MAFKFNSMKKVLTPFLSILLGIFLSSEIANAQGGNLQFNQVVNITPGVSYTVPAGKVFKLESITFSSAIFSTSYKDYVAGGVGCIFCRYNTQNYLTIDGLQFSATGADIYWCAGYTNCPSLSPGGIASTPAISLPIWLKDGKNINLSLNAAGILLTGIEFNITN